MVAVRWYSKQSVEYLGVGYYCPCEGLGVTPVHNQIGRIPTVRGGKLLRISDMHETCMPMPRICNKGPSYAAP